MAEYRERQTECRHARRLEIARVNSQRIEAVFVVPAQMRIDDGDGRAHRTTLSGDQHGIRAAIRRQLEPDSRHRELGRHLRNHPCVEHLPRQRHHIPGVNLLRPRRHLLRVLVHERFDAGLKSFDYCSHLRADFLVFFAGHFSMPDHVLNQVVVIVTGAERFGHSAGSEPVILQQVF